MSSRARCRICSEEITFTHGNPVELGLHMMQRHNSGSVVQYSIHEEDHLCPTQRIDPGKCVENCRKTGGEEQGADGKESFTNGAVNSTWNSIRKFGSGKNSKRKRNYYRKGLYKTTLETWTASGCYMVCPICQKEVKPLIRSQKNKVAYTSLGATFLLSCWPFCFLFPLMHKCAVDLYCPNCKYKLGIYDTSTGTYRTNGNVTLTENNNVPKISTKNA